MVVGVLYWGLDQWRALAEEAAAAKGDSESSITRRAAHEDSDDDSVDSESASDVPTVASPVPPHTTTATIGKIDVVDVGIKEPRLKDVLRRQLDAARNKNQTVLVMLTQDKCAPCHGVDESLSDPRMQRALANVRLVRVNIDVFSEEIKQLRMPQDDYPAFFLLSPDLRPRDGIHGGEWGEDIAENIAPVLGAFVRGNYRERRHHWSPTTSGVEL